MDNLQAKEWFKSAYGDIRNIEYILEDEHLTHIVAFHSQQAVEKILKAILEFEKKNIPKTHKLSNLVSKIEMSIEIDEDMIEILDELYIESRYPTELGLLPDGKPTVTDAKAYYTFVNNLFIDIGKRLNIKTAKIYA